MAAQAHETPHVAAGAARRRAPHGHRNNTSRRTHEAAVPPRQRPDGAQPHTFLPRWKASSSRFGQAPTAVEKLVPVISTGARSTREPRCRRAGRPGLRPPVPRARVERHRPRREASREPSAAPPSTSSSTQPSRSTTCQKAGSGERRRGRRSFFFPGTKFGCSRGWDYIQPPSPGTKSAKSALISALVRTTQFW